MLGVPRHDCVDIGRTQPWWEELWMTGDMIIIVCTIEIGPCE